MTTDFTELLRKEAFQTNPNEQLTENGAVMYKTTGKKLLDLNFALGSMRNWTYSRIQRHFEAAYAENPTLAVLWLFFARDIRSGCGERRVFRAIMPCLSAENPALCEKVLHLIPEYGRWDDLVAFWDATQSSSCKKAALEIIRARLSDDISALSSGAPVSLLAKWLPSENTSSPAVKSLAARLRSALGMAPADYRRTLSKLRARIRVVERDMSSQNWGGISYPAVPSRAMLNYRGAFARHDGERFAGYLDDVRSGRAKINSGVLYPYDIVHACHHCAEMDETLEAQWKALPNTVTDGGSTLVVVDGSYSMTDTIGSTSITAREVAASLGIYFAERLAPPFEGKFITFSSRPQLVQLPLNSSLRLKLDIVDGYDDCSNTDIEKTFMLVLNTAVKNHLKQSELPQNLLIVSDMEFDSATYHRPDENLFKSIERRFSEAGYQLPRLVFWNVNSRTNAVPLIKNPNGVTLVSGFSPNIADMVMSGSLDPWKALVDKLMSDRYLPVRAAIEV